MLYLIKIKSELFSILKSIYLRISNIFFSFHPFKIYEFKELLRGVSFSTDDLILDIGCGDGLLTILLGKRCKKVIGIDISKRSVAKAMLRSWYMKRNINSEFRLVKIEDAGFKDEYFDKIFSICVLEHISNYVTVLKEMFRVLKKEGQLIFSVDSLETIQDKNLIDCHKKKHRVEHYFKKDDLKTILKEIGFKRIIIYPICKGNYANKLFIKGIKSNFKFGYFFSILDYFLIKNKESHCNDVNKGIFLIAKCYK